MHFISTEQAAKKWGVAKRRVQKLCEDERIEGSIRFSGVWAIPEDPPILQTCARNLKLEEVSNRIHIKRIKQLR